MRASVSHYSMRFPPKHWHCGIVFWQFCSRQIFGVQWCLPLPFGMDNYWSIRGLRCLEASSMFIIGVPNHTLGQPPAPSVWNSLTHETASSHSSVAGPLCNIYHLPYPYLMKVRHAITRSSPPNYCQLPRLPWMFSDLLPSISLSFFAQVFLTLY